jgi:hypothetical protein
VEHVTVVKWLGGRTLILQRLPTSRKVLPSQYQRFAADAAILSRQAEAIIERHRLATALANAPEGVETDLL